MLRLAPHSTIGQGSVRGQVRVRARAKSCVYEEHHANARPGQPPSGDQAGSEASVGVVTARSLKPVMSIDTRREPPERDPLPGESRQNMITRPFGQKVGPSTSHAADSRRSADPSGCITPIAKLSVSPPSLVKAIRSPRGDHTGVA